MRSSDVLIHYDSNQNIFLEADSSAYGLGAVISHEVNGELRPIAFASRVLSDCERKYAQYEKEGLSIIFGLKKFHKYLYGHRFIIYTDHKPLVTLFGDGKPVSSMASARIARWQMLLSAYHYEIRHNPGPQLVVPDALSRIPAPDTQSEPAPEIHIDLEERNTEKIAFLEVDTRPICAQEIRKAVDKDPVLSSLSTRLFGVYVI